MKTLLHLPLACLALMLAGADAQTPADTAGSVATATNSAAATTTSAAPLPPVGIIILRAVAGYDAAGIAFTSIQWNNNDGGCVTDAAGNKTPFLNDAIGKIIYFDESYYAEVDHNAYWVDWRAGLQNREVVVAPIETIRLVPSDAPRLQSEEALLQSILDHNPPGQPVVQPMIDTLKDQCAKLASGQMLDNGQWVAVNGSQGGSSLSDAVPSIGENGSSLTFTTKTGRKFVNARVSLNDTGVIVITDDGGASLSFDELPDDLTGFPDVVRKQAQAERDKAKAVASAAPASSDAAASSEGAPSSTSATSSAPSGIWGWIKYYAVTAWNDVYGLFSKSTTKSTTSTPSTPAPAATPAPAPASKADSTPPAAPAPASAPASGSAPASAIAAPPAIPGLSANAVVLIKGDKAEGTGFFAKTANGPVVITNLHVLASNPNVRIITSSGQEVQTTDLKGASDRDLAMFSIVDQGYTYLDLASNVEQNANVGDPTIIPGNSEGGEVTLKTNGKVVAIGPQLLEFDNPVYHGNSGGPVFDVRTGKVVAVVVGASKVNPTDELDKDSFANANSAIKGPMRYFGFRLDTVPTWDPYDANRFLSETLFLQDFHEVSRALDSFLNGAGYGNASSSEEGPPDAKYYLNNDKVRRLAEDYNTTLQNHDKSTAIQELVWSLSNVVDEDLPTAQDGDRFYPFNRDRAKFEVRYRQALKDEIARIQTGVHDATSGTHNDFGL